MIVRDLKGRTCKMPTKPYLIDWDRAVSKPQKAVKDFLWPYWAHDIVLEELRVPHSLLRIDLMNASRGIVIEVSPTATHAIFSEFFHVSTAGWTASLKRDMDKEHWATIINGFAFVEITDVDFPLTPEVFARQGVTL